MKTKTKKMKQIMLISSIWSWKFRKKDEKNFSISTINQSFIDIECGGKKTNEANYSLFFCFCFSFLFHSFIHDIFKFKNTTHITIFDVPCRYLLKFLIFFLNLKMLMFFFLLLLWFFRCTQINNTRLSSSSLLLL